MYNTVDVLRGGPIRDLPLDYDPNIGKLTFQKDGKIETVQDTRTNPEQAYCKWGVTLGFFVNPDQPEKDPFEVLRNMKRKYPGHTAFEYNSINPFVVNRINERIGDELFSEMVWSKIGED